MANISEQILGHDVGNYVEMYDLLLGDTITGIPSDNIFLSTSVRFNQSTGDTTHINWKGNVYDHIPIESSGFKVNLEGTSAQPMFSLSNIDHSRFVPLVDRYNELVGVEFVRWRTFENFIDDAGQPFIGRDRFVISQLVSMSNTTIKFKLISKIDRDDAKVPFRQVLRDVHEHAGKSYTFPGVSRSGSRLR